MPRILITGINGFIGRYMEQEATGKGYQVSGLDIAPGKAKSTNVVIGDIRNKDDVDESMEGADYVIHLAAITSNVQFEQNPVACYETNVNGFLNVIDAAVRNKCKRFVYASSAAVYLDEFSETANIDIKKVKSHYGKTKLINEMIAKSYEDIYKIKTIGLRFFNVYGKGENLKGDYASVITRFYEMDKSGNPIVIYGDGTQSRDMVNVTDVARIALELLEKGTYNVYNVGTGNATSYNAVADMINKGNKKFVNNPLSSYQILTKADTRRLTETLGNYKFIGLEEGIKEVASPSE